MYKDIALISTRVFHANKRREKKLWFSLLVHWGCIYNGNLAKASWWNRTRAWSQIQSLKYSTTHPNISNTPITITILEDIQTVTLAVTEGNLREYTKQAKWVCTVNLIYRAKWTSLCQLKSMGWSILGRSGITWPLPGCFNFTVSDCYIFFKPSALPKAFHKTETELPLIPMQWHVIRRSFSPLNDWVSRNKTFGII